MYDITKSGKFIYSSPIKLSRPAHLSSSLCLDAKHLHTGMQRTEREHAAVLQSLLRTLRDGSRSLETMQTPT